VSTSGSSSRPVLSRWPAIALASLLIASGLVLWLAIAAASHPSTAYGDGASIDDRALAIENELQCPVCQNVTVAYSGSTLAGQMREVVHEQLAAGKSHDQIIQYFVDRYGEAILTQPPKHGLNLLAWLLPLAGLALGLAAVASVLRSRRGISESAGPAASAEPGLSADDERLLATALEEIP